MGLASEEGCYYHGRIDGLEGQETNVQSQQKLESKWSVSILSEEGMANAGPADLLHNCEQLSRQQAGAELCQAQVECGVEACHY